MFSTFDAPDGALSCGRRQSTTVAPQSLALMNSETMQRQARAFATLLMRQAEDNPDRWIELAWLRALARKPDDAEMRHSSELLRSLEQPGTAKAEALAKFCLAVFNLNEFLYVD